MVLKNKQTIFLAIALTGFINLNASVTTHTTSEVQNKTSAMYQEKYNAAGHKIRRVVDRINDSTPLSPHLVTHIIAPYIMDQFIQLTNFSIPQHLPAIQLLSNEELAVQTPTQSISVYQVRTGRILRTIQNLPKELDWPVPRLVTPENLTYSVQSPKLSYMALQKYIASAKISLSELSIHFTGIPGKNLLNNTSNTGFSTITFSPEENSFITLYRGNATLFAQIGVDIETD